jgi:uncharacterized protein
MTQGEPLTAPFWAAAAQGRLVRPVCDQCGHGFFPPAWCCPRCHCESWTYRESSGRGRVYSHTTVHRGPDPSWPVPYVLAIVDLDEGWSMLSRITGDPPDDSVPGALIGRAVRVSFADEERPPHRVLPVFELAQTELAEVRP